MTDSDFREFSGLLDAVCGLLSRGAYAPNATNTALFFRSLRAYPLDAVRGAFDAHVSDPVRGRFVPVPADLLAQLQARAENDGRLGAEEAWALVMAGRDESDTVVWTDEIGQAWGIARVVYEQDDVGGRMAFREAYGRLVAEARAAGRPVSWRVLEGHDAARRIEAVKAAVAIGRVPSDAAERLALAPPAPRAVVALLEGPAPAAASPEVRSALLRLRDVLAARTEATKVDMGRVRTDDARAWSGVMVEEYAAARGLALKPQQATA